MHLSKIHAARGDFSIFRRFPSRELALEMQELLQEEGIECILGDNIPPFDVTFSGSTLQHRYEIRLHPSDFEKAEKVLAEWADNLIYDVDPGYYLFSFTDEELYQILIKPDEWSTHDYALARKVLERRGVVVNESLLSALRKKRIEELAKPESSQREYIILGYFLASFGSLLGGFAVGPMGALAGGFPGIIIGYLLWKSRKTLPNGQRVPSYTANDRWQGRNIFVISSLILLFYIIRGFIQLIP